MVGFEYLNGQLHCDGVRIDKIAEEIGTPFYLYSHKLLINNYEAYAKAFGQNTIICYACKANSNLSILKVLTSKGCGADVLSSGELFKALKAGVPPEMIVFNGNGKTKKEMIYGLENNILMFNVDSRDELILLNSIAKEMNKTARIAFRVNPDINPITHPYLATGLAKSKFGLPIHQVKEIYKEAIRLENIEVKGIHSHIGSHIIKVHLLLENIQKLIKLANELKDIGIEIEYLNMGGGLGIVYQDEKVSSPTELAELIIPALSGTNYKLILEPGRSIVGKSGILVTQVLYIKKGYKNFIVVDAAMNDLIRPVIYDAYHNILPVNKKESVEHLTADIVGPICESSDFLGKDRDMVNPESGDLFAIMDSGAYGFVMASNYNMRPRAAEVLIVNGQHYIIRKRESNEDLIAMEIPIGFDTNNIIRR